MSHSTASISYPFIKCSRHKSSYCKTQLKSTNCVALACHGLCSNISISDSPPPTPQVQCCSVSIYCVTYTYRDEPLYTSSISSDELHSFTHPLLTPPSTTSCIATFRNGPMDLIRPFRYCHSIRSIPDSNCSGKLIVAGYRIVAPPAH